MTAAKKAFKIAGNVIFVAVLAVMLVIVGFMVKGKLDGGVPNIAGYQIYTVLSGSMEPTFMTGSMVAVESANPQDIRTGDIITFKKTTDEKEITVTHRVIDITSNAEGQLQYTTKGDNNNTTDMEPVPASNLIGREVFDIPYGGYISEFTKSREGLIILIIIPGFLVVLMEIKNLWTYATEYDRQQEEEKLAAATASQE